MEITTQLYVEHIGQWRSWLENHHLTETEVWLVFDKKDAEKYQLDYIETVEEALCFGWIDGIKKKDGDRTASAIYTASDKQSLDRTE